MKSVPRDEPLCVCGGTGRIRPVQSGQNHLVVCDRCSHFAQPCASEQAAWAHWRRANGVGVCCIGCQSKPRLVYRKADRRWEMVCTHCRFNSGAACSDQGAISSWIRSNKPRDPHIKQLWQERYLAQG